MPPQASQRWRDVRPVVTSSTPESEVKLLPILGHGRNAWMVLRLAQELFCLDNDALHCLRIVCVVDGPNSASGVNQTEDGTMQYGCARVAASLDGDVEALGNRLASLFAGAQQEPSRIEWSPDLCILE